MNGESFDFEFRLRDFDLGLLPVDPALLKADPELLRRAVEDLLGDHFGRVGGEAVIVADRERVRVRWTAHATADFDRLKEQAFQLLRDGAVAQAQPIIKALLWRNPEDSDLLVNVAMLLSDAGQPEEAVSLLEGLVSSEPANPSAWNVLGVALWRTDRLDEAEAALGRAYGLAPDDAHVLKNYGALLAKRDAEAALPILAKAAERLPDDQPALYNLGLCLQRTGDFEGAVRALHRAIEVAPYTDVAEQCQAFVSRISLERTRSGPAAPKMDAVMYCLAALRGYAAMEPGRRQSVAAEIALLGQNGFDIGDPAKKYRLRTLEGQYSGLELLCWMYVGFQQIDPTAGAEIDLRSEYEAAVQLFETGGGSV